MMWLQKRIYKESLSKGIDVVQMSNGMGMVTSQPEKKISFKQKLDQTLSNFRGA